MKSILDKQDFSNLDKNEIIELLQLRGSDELNLFKKPIKYALDIEVIEFISEV